MGEGLYVDRAGRTVFCDPLDDCDHADFESDAERLDEGRRVWDDFVLELVANLAPPWVRIEAERWLPWPHRDVRILAETGLHQLTLHQDGYGRAHVTVRVRDDLQRARPLAERALDAAAARVFARLAATRPLRVRDTAWTSRSYDPGAGKGI